MAEHSHHEPPGLPTIQDEAADTPMWVPVVGIALLAAFAMLFVYQAATSRQTADGAAEQAAPSEAGDAPEGEPEAAAEPAE